MKYKHGFSLIELILYMGMLSVILLVLSQLFIIVINSKLESEATNAIAQDSRYIMSKLSYDINRAKNIVLPVNIGETSNNLQIVNNDTGTDINYSYLIQDNNLILINNYGTNRLNSADTQISNLNFTRLGNLTGKNSIQFSFRITSIVIKNKNFPEYQDFISTVNIR